jgi:hypothetical protein
VALSFTDPAVTVDEANTYAQARNWLDWDDAEDADREAAILRAQTYIAATYNGKWRDEWDNADAPDNVKFAIIEAARRELARPGSLAPDYDPSGSIKRQRKEVGPLKTEVEYAIPADADGAAPRIPIIDYLLAGVIGPAGGAGGMNFAVTRA